MRPNYKPTARGRLLDLAVEALKHRDLEMVNICLRLLATT